MKTAKILKFYPEKCNGCLDCEKACSNVHFKVDSGGEKSAIRILEKTKGYEMQVCNHCGLCIDLCQVLALKKVSANKRDFNKPEYFSAPLGLKNL